MRTWGRVYDRNADGSIVKGSVPYWRLVETTPDGFNDGVYLTTLIQCLQLVLNESPFYARFGIPSQISVVQQLFPDYYVMETQRQFSPFFASLIIAKQENPTPTYRINVVTNQGFPLSANLPIGS